jgi:tetratricopeptide (TPR) repeat protein
MNVRALGHVQMIYSYFHEGRVRDAVAETQKFISEQGAEGSNEGAFGRSIVAEALWIQGRKAEAAAEARRAAEDARGRLSISDALLEGSIAGDANARTALQRLADALPTGADKALPFLVDAIVAIEAGRANEAGQLLSSYESAVRPGMVAAGSLVPVRQPRAMLNYWRGRERLALGDFKAAIDSFEKNTGNPGLRMFNPIEYVRGLYYTAQAWEKSGDAARAREYYQRFLSYWRNGDIDRDKVAEAIKKSATS